MSQLPRTRLRSLTDIGLARHVHVGLRQLPPAASAPRFGVAIGLPYQPQLTVTRSSSTIISTFGS